MKKYLFIIFFLVPAVWITAQNVTQEMAQKKAMEFMNQVGMNPEHLTRKLLSGDNVQENAPLYIFDARQGNGFVIVSGDERTSPILGYVRQGSFDERQIPENMRAWLYNYARDIRLLQEGRVETNPLKVSTHPAIKTMMTTKWSQGTADATGTPYNQLCPKINNVYCLTGCLATAMAQVMNYHQWPESFSTSIPSYTPNDKIGQLAELPAYQFDWDNMLNKYWGEETKEQCTAVAKLMRYCGQALQMDYDTGGSGAFCNDVAIALQSYFGYDINTRFELRSDYTAESWDELIYNELSNGRPVLYNGESTDYRHAFVCDGYDGKGFYHINWGWSGTFNGFFRLAVLNPKGGGIGSTGTSDGYSINQGAVVGIQPSTGTEDEIRMLTLKNLWSNGSVLKAKFSNRTGSGGKFEFGLVFHKIGDDANTFFLSSKKAYFEEYQMYSIAYDISKWGLEDGTYRFYPFSRLVDEEWYRVSGDFYTYLEVIIWAGIVVSVEKHPQSELMANALECVSNKVVNLTQEMKVTVTNSGDEWNDLLYLFASKNSYYKGTAVNTTNVVVEAGATEEASLYFTPTSTGTWYVWVSTDASGNNVLAQTKMSIRAMPTTTTNLKVVSCDIDAKPTTNVKVKVKNIGSDGYFMPITCFLFPDTGGHNIEGQKTGYLNIAKNSTAELSFDFEGLEVGKSYFVSFMDYTDHQSGYTSFFTGRYSFTVEPDPLRGDVNDDGQVDISDVLITVDSILGRSSEVFVRENADVIQDGKIDISDVLEIVNIIMSE